MEMQRSWHVIVFVFTNLLIADMQLYHLTCLPYWFILVFLLNNVYVMFCLCLQSKVKGTSYLRP